MATGGSKRRVAFVTLVLVTASLAGCLDAWQDRVTPAASVDGVFSATNVFPGDYDTDAHRVLERGPFDVLSQEVAHVESDLDGADVMIYVMRPDVPDGVTVPVIVDVGPYFPGLEGADLSGSDLLVDFVSHGYAFALVAVRGTGNSGGCMDLMGPKERHDVDQAITWLGTRDWSNGNVGMFGGSYDGSTQWTAASTGNPHLKTIVPLAAIPDLFSFLIRNGTAMAWTPAQFGALYWAFYGPALYNPATGRSVENTVAQVVCPESKEGMAASVASTLTGERDPLGWWAERNWMPEVEANYRGTVFLIHGFRDITVEPHTAYPWVNQLEESGVIVKHMLGPWGHELPWRADVLEILLRWYDRWLKEDDAVDVGPRVQVMDNLHRWRSESAWPPADAAPLTLHLTGDGGLDEAPGSAGEHLVGSMIPVHDPQDLAGRLNAFWQIWERPAEEVCAECPVFATAVLDEDLRFAGSPRLHATVTPTGPGGHVTAILHVVHEDGERDRVGFTQMDLRFADGGDAARTVVPGEPLVARLAFQPLDVVVPAGATLTLTLHQGSYGLRMPSTPTYPVMLETGGDASTLTLDVFQRAPGDFHEAPARVGPDAPPR